MTYQLPPLCYPQSLKHFKLSLFLSIHLAVFLSVNLSIDLFHCLNINIPIIAADPGAGIGIVFLIIAEK